MDLEKIYKIVLKLQNTPGRLDKMAILKANKDDQGLKYILNFAFNGFIRVGIKDKKLNKFINKQVIPTKKYKDLKDLLEYLKANPTGKDEQLINAAYYLNQIQDKEVQHFVFEVITKSLSVGCTAKTLNSVYENGFCHDFQPLKGHKYIDSRKDKKSGKRIFIPNYKRLEGKEVVITKKWDGNRCFIEVDNDQTLTLKTDSGRIMEGFSVVMSIIHEQIIKDPAFKNFVLDCEILASNPEGLDSRSLFKKTQKIVKRKGEKDPNSIDLRCFDYIPLNDFKNGFSDKPCVTRKYSAERTVNFINLPFVNYVDILYRGMFDEEINNALYKEAISKRDEGIIIQVANSPYECKRTFTMIKMKAAESCDIRCIGVYEGLKERTKGTLGGIHVDYKGYTSTDVGGGFSQEERKLYWEHPELIVGKIVQVDFMQETATDDGELTMRQPEFRCIREEKTEPSYN